MKLIRYILFPISLIYGFITFLRNKLFDYSILKSTSFDLPIISVGNLCLGGSGKTPHTEYLIRLLKDQYKLATLSRGYGRITSGYFLADKFTDANDIGDEPMQFHQKFEDISVAVDSKRVRGIRKLLEETRVPDLIILDDAYQHRYVKPGLQILLTPYNDLYSDDFVFPTGNLREFSFGSDRADIIVVTKCPDKISNQQFSSVKSRLRVKDNQSLYFSKIVYGSMVFGWDKVLEITDLKDYSVLLVTGIANPHPLINFLKSYDISFKHLKFADHHNFTKVDVLEIRSSFANLGSGQKIILTTEKDYVRLCTTEIYKSNLMYIPISIDFLNGDKKSFDQKILDYAKSNKANS